MDKFQSSAAVQQNSIDSLTIEQLISNLLAAQINFIDLQFPPQLNSIIPNYSNNSNLLQSLNPNHIVWRRAHQFIDKPSLTDPAIDPADIRQGEFSNLWFCSALSALAEFPSFISGLFDSQHEVNTVGIYRLNLFHHGNPIQLTVDDYFPCYPGAGSPIISRNHGSQLWVSLTEKSYAKMLGNYIALKSTTTVQGIINDSNPTVPARALADLTGLPVEYIEFQSQNVQSAILRDELWPKIIQLDSQGCCMIIGTRTFDSNMNSLGLSPNMYYTVLRVFESSTTGVRVLKVRNPWNRIEFTGQWRNNSSEWNEQLIHELNRSTVDVDDGIFYLDYSEFIKLFNSISILYSQSPLQLQWHSTRFTGSFTTIWPFSSNQFYSFTVSQSTGSNLFISLYHRLIQLNSGF